MSLELTLLRPEATRRETVQCCAWAKEQSAVCVTVLPSWVADAADALTESKSEIIVGTVIGYPYGFAPAQAKGVEAAMATADGAQELTLYLNLSALKSGAELLAADDVQSVVDAAAPSGAKVIVHLPWDALKPQERQSAARLAVECGADAVLLPTADAESAKALREFLPEEVELYIACTTDAEAELMRACGAVRIVRAAGNGHAPA